MLSPALVELDEREPAGVANTPVAVAKRIGETSSVSDVDQPHDDSLQYLSNA